MYSSVLVLILKANLPKVRLPMHNVKAITDYRMSKITCIKFSTIIENSLSGLQLMTFNSAKLPCLESAVALNVKKYYSLMNWFDCHQLLHFLKFIYS